MPTQASSLLKKRCVAAQLRKHQWAVFTRDSKLSALADHTDHTGHKWAVQMPLYILDSCQTFIVPKIMPRVIVYIHKEHPPPTVNLDHSRSSTSLCWAVIDYIYIYIYAIHSSDLFIISHMHTPLLCGYYVGVQWHSCNLYTPLDHSKKWNVWTNTYWLKVIWSKMQQTMQKPPLLTTRLGTVYTYR